MGEMKGRAQKFRLPGTKKILQKFLVELDSTKESQEKLLSNMCEVLSPRESGKFIAENAERVTINPDKIPPVAQQVLKHLQSRETFADNSQSDIHTRQDGEEAINWIFLIDTLNYCFWLPEADHWTVTWKGKCYTGYRALCAAINRALDEGYSITDPKYYSQISLSHLKTILRGDNKLVTVPLLNKRLDCLHEVGLILLERFDGKFSNCIAKSEGSAEKLLRLVVDNFPCFRDEAVYKGKKVSFYKRAQILVGDIWAHFKGMNEGCFEDIEKLTMFADYRVPQVLVHFGILKYSKELTEKLVKGVLLESGSDEEVEIRGCSIHAVELIKEEVARIAGGQVTGNVAPPDANGEGPVVCNSVLIDHYLWDFRRDHAAELLSVPFHKTLSVSY